MLRSRPESAERVDFVFQTAVLLLTANGYSAILLSGSLDIFSAMVMAAALGVRLLKVLRIIRFSLPKFVFPVLTFGYVFFYVADVLALSGFVTATLRMMFFYTALRLITAREDRHYFYLGMLAFLHLMAASMFVAGVGYLAALLSFLFWAILAYTAFEIRRGCRLAPVVMQDRDERRRRWLGTRLAGLSVMLAGGILVLSFGIFLVIPRTLWSGSVSPLRGDYTVGFSDEVNLSATGSVQLDHTPVLRAKEMSGASLDGLKWRGLALHHFDGTRWSNRSRDHKPVEPKEGAYVLPAPSRFAERGRMVRYEVDVEPMASRFLFYAGQPKQITGPFRRLLLTETGSYRVPFSRFQPLHYQVQSWLPEGSPERAADVVELFSKKFRGLYLQLPDIDPRIRRLAERIADREDSPLRQGAAIERFLRNGFGYTLDLPSRKPKDPLAHFLFERKEGHCEYFASAMAVMLRTLDIPSRVVNGFLHGVYNPLSGEQVIRSSDAHSWVEAYLPGYGWREFDPTPPNPDAGMGLWASYFWMYWDAVESGWSAWVVDYDRSRQLTLAIQMQNRSRRAMAGVFDSLSEGKQRISDWLDDRVALLGSESLGVLLLRISLLIVLPAVLVWGALRLRPALIRAYRRRRVLRGQGRASDSAYFYGYALDLLERRGFRRGRNQTAEEFAESVTETNLRGIVSQLTLAYNGARFGHDRSSERRLPQLVQALERSR